MTIFTDSATLRLQLQEANNALIACLKSQEYRIGDRTYTRADLPEIRATISDLEARLAAAEGQAGPGFYSTRRARR